MECIQGTRVSIWTSRTTLHCTLLLADPSLGNGPDIRQPEPLQPLLGIFPGSKGGVEGASDSGDEQEGAEEGGEGDEEVEEEEDDEERGGEQGGLVGCRVVRGYRRGEGGTCHGSGHSRCGSRG